MSENLNLQTVETVDTRPFRHLVMTIGELPTSFVESMTYYELLAWFTNYLETVIIPTVNNNGECVRELQDKFTELTGLFNELKSYVDNYFDNLDVQEEINNKLDAMVEDGTLQEIITTYIQSNVAWVFDNVADMKASTNLINGSYAQTLGFYSSNDGGGSIFKISNSASGNFTIKINSTLYANLVNNNTSINVAQLGAKSDETTLDDLYDTLEDAQVTYPDATDLSELVGNVAIQHAINYYANKTILIPNARYWINKTLIIPNNDGERVYILGAARMTSAFRWYGSNTDNSPILRLTNHTARCTIENISFVGYEDATDTTQATLESYPTTGIFLYSSTNHIIRNCGFYRLNKGIEVYHAWVNSIDHCYFQRCNHGIFTLDEHEGNNITVDFCMAEYVNYGFNFGRGRTQKVVNCDIEHANIAGIAKRYYGDIIVKDCYFESNILIIYDTVAVSNVTIDGCSFYQNRTIDDFYNPIVLDGTDDSNFTISNNFFTNATVIEGDYNTNHVVAVYSQSNKTLKNVFFFSNSTTNLGLHTKTLDRGIDIQQGQIYNFRDGSYHRTYLSASNDNTTLMPNGFKYARLGLADTSYTLKLPTISENGLDSYYQHEFELALPTYTSDSATGVITIAPDNASTCDVQGLTSITAANKGKIIKCVWIGNYNYGGANKTRWLITD